MIVVFIFVNSNSILFALSQDIIINELGQLAVEGLTPADTKLVFTENEVLEYCKCTEQACGMGIIRLDRALEGGSNVQFFHKSAQEFCAGRYLSNHIEKLSAYLEEVETVEDALSVALVLTFASSQRSAARLIVEKLMEIYHEEIESDMTDFKREHLAFEDTRPIQAFLELCLECNYEADAGAEFGSILSDLFADGKVLFYGIPAKAATTLAYYIERCKPAIRSLNLRPIAHASEPPRFFGPTADSYQAALKTLKPLSDNEIKERHDKFKIANPDLDLYWKRRNHTTQLAAYIMSIQACEGLPPASETNVVPIITSLEHIKLEVLCLQNYKLGADFDSVVQAVEDGNFQLLHDMRVEDSASTGQQMTRLVTSMHKMPLLDTLIISKNPAEPGRTIPTLAENIASCKSLRYLNVCDMQAPADDLVILAATFPTQLEVLYLRGNEMNDELASRLVDTLPRTLQRLYIDVDNLSLGIHNELLQALESRCKLLIKLGVFRSPYAPDLVKYLGQSLKRTWRDNMTKLLLSSSSTELIREDCFEIFMEGIQAASVVNSCMQGINLDRERFGRLIQLCHEKGFDELR